MKAGLSCNYCCFSLRAPCSTLFGTLQCSVVVFNVLSFGYTETKYIKLKLKIKILFFVISILLYTLKRGTRKLFSLLKKRFLVPLIPKCIKESSNFHLHQQKIVWFLVLCIWFQFIQRKEHKFHFIPLSLYSKVTSF